MITICRRLFWLALLGGAGFAVWTAWQRKNEPAAPGPAEWPPLSTSDSSRGSTSDTPADASFADLGSAGAAAADTGSDSGDDDTDTGSAGDGRWVEPTDGACPLSHPVKANDNSGIFHLPGGRFYDRTGAERCYATAEDAEADGYRRAKS